MTISVALTVVDPEPVFVAAVHGDAAAWEEIYRRFNRPLARLSRGSAVEPDDFVQSCFTEAYRFREQLRDVGSFGSWLFAIARNQRAAAFAVKARWSSKLVQSDDQVEQPGDATPEVDTFAKQAYLALPLDSRSCWIGCYVEGRTIREVAADEGISISTVKRRLRRAQLRIANLGYR